MDSSTNCNNCDEAASSKSELILVSKPDDNLSDAPQQSVNAENVEDVTPPDQTARLDGEKDKTVDHTAVVIEQQILVEPFQRAPEISTDGNTNEKSYNKSELNDNIDETSSVKNTNQELNVENQTPEESSSMMIDEEHLETSVDTIIEKSSDSQVTVDNLMHARDLDNSEDKPSTGTPFDVQPVVILNPAPTAIKSEKDPDLNQSSSLALLAQYDTEDDSDDDVREVPAAHTYQNRCVEIDSDSSTSDVEFLSEVRNSINLEMLDVDNEGEDDEDEEEGGNIRTKRQPKVKGELHLEDLPPIEDLHITVPEEECTELGKIHSIVEQLVLVDALPGTVPLDLETVLFRDKGNQVLGEVFDVLGQVSDPLYCVRFNSNKEIKEKGIEVGQTIYVAPRTKHTQFVVLANLMKVRGSDASWENDVEPPPRFIDYSDDEEERSARRPNRKRQSSAPTYIGRGSYTPRRPYRGNYSGRGAGYQHQPHQSQGNYNIVGNSWHSNFYQPPMFNQPHYRTPGHSPGGYMRPPFHNSPYQQPPPVNPGLVVNPYAVYPPPQAMQQPLFPPPHHQHPPPQ